MIAVDGSYLYVLGQEIKPLHEITKDSQYAEVWLKCYAASQGLETFISDSVFKNAIQVMVEPANALIFTLNTIRNKVLKTSGETGKLDDLNILELKTTLQAFESVFKAELKIGNLFLATPKGAYDLRALIANGESLFPENAQAIFSKIALQDVRQGARCLAFELYTASGFHFHRANEAVVLRYLKALGVTVPKTRRNLGVFVKELEKAGAPDKIISCLRDLKDMHRNPLIHPDQSINNFGDALLLVSAIQGAVSAMAKEIEKLEKKK